jgi:hypothetical protein
MLLDVIDHRVALNSTETISQEFDNSEIRLHCGKCFAILVAPVTQQNATAGQCCKGAHRDAIPCLKAP